MIVAHGFPRVFCGFALNPKPHLPRQTQEDRVNSHLADCNRRAEVELEILGSNLGVLWGLRFKV